MKGHYKSKLDNSMRYSERIGKSVQSVSIVMSIYIVYCGQYLGFIALTSTILIDFVLPIKKASRINLAIKLFLLFQVIMVYFFLLDTSSQSSLSTISELRGSITKQSSESRTSTTATHQRKAIIQSDHDSDLIADKTDLAHDSSIVVHNNNINHHYVYSKMDNTTLNVFVRVFNLRKNFPPIVNFPDLQYRSPIEIKRKLKGLFDDLPSKNNSNNNNNNNNKNGFLSNFKNPCWYKTDENDGSRNLICLPYAYILGQPKCGTSDLFERLKSHPDVSMPARKEVRFFTRGEFTRDPLEPEPPPNQHHPSRYEYKLSEYSSLTGFTQAFSAAIPSIQKRPTEVITIDGGPHTFWWPTQSPDDTLLPEDIPPLQIIHLLQPHAPFLLTFTDPVRRTYSDYYFLNDDMKVNRPIKDIESINHHHHHQDRHHQLLPNEQDLQRRQIHDNNQSEKSKEHFHERMVIQIQSFKECIVNISKQIIQTSTLTTSSSSSGTGSAAGVTLDESEGEEANTDGVWFRASQICAHDRSTYGRAGWGRINIGLYALYFEKWLEYFPLSQFLVSRLEDYDDNPRLYLQRIYDFLHLRKPSENEWEIILRRQRANVNHIEKQEMMIETEVLLREFYQPYNDILAVMLQDKRYQWLDTSSSNSVKNKQDKTGDSQNNNNNNKDINYGNNSNMNNQQQQHRPLPPIMDDDEQQQFQQQQGIPQELHIIQPRTVHQHHQQDNADNTDTDIDNGDIKRKKLELEIALSREKNTGSAGGLLSLFGGKEKATNLNDIFSPHHGNYGHNKRQQVSTSSSAAAHFTSQAFNIGDLPRGHTTEITHWLSKYIHYNRPPTSLIDGAHQLAMAVFALDIPAIKYLLYDIGVPVNTIHNADYDRTAIITLSMVGTLAEGHGKSHVFNLLKGHETWLTPYFTNPILPTQQHSVHAIDIVDGLQEAIYNVSSWLFRAGADITMLDSAGLSALHYAAVNGMTGLTRDMLVYHQNKLLEQQERSELQQQGRQLQVQEEEQGNETADAEESSSSLLSLTSLLNLQPESTGRTPLHWAIAQGHVAVGKLLVDYGADLYIEDNWGVSCYDMLANPGATSAADALNYFNVTQRPVRTIHRAIHPEWFNHTSANANEINDSSSSNKEKFDNPMEELYRRWPGNGGWGDRRLAGYETDMECEVDQYWANEITGADIFNKYIARNTPILIRGLIHEWGAITVYTKNMLNQTFGDINVQVSNIPYYNKFGGENGGMQEMMLSEYISEVENHKLLGGNHPWYVFRGHPIPTISDPMLVNKTETITDSITNKTITTTKSVPVSVSFVPLDIVQTPAHMQSAFERVNDEKDSSMRGREGVEARKVFVNAQWAFGGEGTGAPVHYHNTAWNALVYGAKKWLIYPPHDQVMSNRQILHYLETDVETFQTRDNNNNNNNSSGNIIINNNNNNNNNRSSASTVDGRRFANFRHKSCVQTAGDVMIIPESWGHGVLNIQESVAVATEARAAHWRIKPNTALLSYLPEDNRIRSRKQQMQQQQQIKTEAVTGAAGTKTAVA